MKSISAGSLYGDFIFSNTETGAIFGGGCLSSVRDFRFPQCVNEVLAVLGCYLALIGK